MESHTFFYPFQCPGQNLVPSRCSENSSWIEVPWIHKLYFWRIFTEKIYMSYANNKYLKYKLVKWYQVKANLDMKAEDKL